MHTPTLILGLILLNATGVPRGVSSLSSAGGNPPRARHEQLLKHARLGNEYEVVRTLKEFPATVSQLNFALAASARFGHVVVLEVLVRHGADDLNSAMYHAAAANQIQALRWLTSPSREKPAQDLEGARETASVAGATEAEWVCLSVMRERLDREGKAE